MFVSVLLWTLSVAKLSVLESADAQPLKTTSLADVATKNGEVQDSFKEHHEKMKELLERNEEREKEREKMFKDKEETMKAKNQMFDQREEALDKMLGMKEQLIDKKEHDFERQTAAMERENADSDSDRDSDSDSDDSSFLETGSRWSTGADERRAEKKFESMSAAVARKQANTREELKHLQYDLDRTPSSFAQVAELPTFPKAFAKLAEDPTLQSDDEKVQDDEKNVDEKYDELQNTLKQMSPEKAVAEDEARAELDEDEPSSFLETGLVPDYGQAYLELLAKGGIKAHYSKRAKAAGVLAQKLEAAADKDESASKSALLKMVKENQAKFDASMKTSIADADANADQWSKMMQKKRTEEAAEKLASSFMEEAARATSPDEDEDDEMKKVEERAIESAADIEDIDKKIKTREAAEQNGEKMLEAEIKKHEANAAKILQSEPDLIGNIEKNLRDEDTK